MKPASSGNYSLYITFFHWSINCQKVPSIPIPSGLTGAFVPLKGQWKKWLQNLEQTNFRMFVPRATWAYLVYMCLVITSIYFLNVWINEYSNLNFPFARKHEILSLLSNLLYYPKFKGGKVTHCPRFLNCN